MVIFNSYVSLPGRVEGDGSNWSRLISIPRHGMMIMMKTGSFDFEKKVATGSCPKTDGHYSQNGYIYI